TPREDRSPTCFDSVASSGSPCWSRCSASPWTTSPGMLGARSVRQDFGGPKISPFVAYPREFVPHPELPRPEVDIRSTQTEQLPAAQPMQGNQPPQRVRPVGGNGINPSSRLTGPVAVERRTARSRPPGRYRLAVSRSTQTYQCYGRTVTN